MLRSSRRQKPLTIDADKATLLAPPTILDRIGRYYCIYTPPADQPRTLPDCLVWTASSRAGNMIIPGVEEADC